MALQSSNRRWALLLAGWVTLLPEGVLAQAPTSAEAPSSASESAGIKSDQLSVQGVKARIAGDETAAFRLFDEAYALQPSPRLNAQLGLAAKSLRRWVLAEQHLEQALSSVEQDPWISQNRAVLEEARRFVADHLATVRLACNAPLARVRINDGPLQALEPQGLRVVAGENQVAFEAPGYETRLLRIDVAAHETRTVRLELRPRPPARPPALATQATASHPRSESSRLPLYLGGAVALAGATAGTLLTLRAIDQKHERDAVCPSPRCPDPRGVELDRSGRRAARFATVGFLVSGAGLGTTLFWLIAHWRAGGGTEAARGLRVTPTGVSYSGRF